MAENPTTDLLGALRPWSEAAARLIKRDPAKWIGFEFHGVAGKGMWVIGRTGRYGRATSVWVELSEVNSDAAS